MSRYSDTSAVADNTVLSHCPRSPRTNPFVPSLLWKTKNWTEHGYWTRFSSQRWLVWIELISASV